MVKPIIYHKRYNAISFFDKMTGDSYFDGVFSHSLSLTLEEVEVLIYGISPMIHSTQHRFSRFAGPADRYHDCIEFPLTEVNHNKIIEMMGAANDDWFMTYKHVDGARLIVLYSNNKPLLTLIKLSL